jgi:hypothetical protein
MVCSCMECASASIHACGHPLCQQLHLTHPHTPLLGGWGWVQGPPRGPPQFWGPGAGLAASGRHLACRLAGASAQSLGIAAAYNSSVGGAAVWPPAVWVLQGAGHQHPGGCCWWCCWAPGLPRGWRCSRGVCGREGSAAVQRCRPVNTCTGRAELLVHTAGRGAAITVHGGIACHGRAGAGCRCGRVVPHLAAAGGSAVQLVAEDCSYVLPREDS